MTRSSGTAPRLLLLSNSRDSAGRYLEWPRDAIRAFLGPAVKSAVFVPYAIVRGTREEYATRVREAFEAMGFSLTAVIDGVHASAASAIANAEAIVVGGGNTFRLLEQLASNDLLAEIRARVAAGVPYIGWSAGSVVTCPTIRTTNDMPIIEPKSLRALGLVPFQINAHYTTVHPPGFQGETRDERLAEFLELNRSVDVIALPEGTLLRVEGRDVEVWGSEPAKRLRFGEDAIALPPGTRFRLGDAGRA
jgi:dipeptidase E